MSTFLENRGWSFTTAPFVPFEINTRSHQSHGLTGWWPTLFSNGGYTLYDLTHGSNGTIDPDASWVYDSMVGAGFRFDSSVEDIVIPHTSSLNTPTGMTLSFWVNRHGDTTSSTIYPIVKSDNSSANESWRLRIETHDFKFRVTNSSGTTSSETIADGETASNNLILVTCRYNGAEIQIFLNGLANGTPVAWTTGIRNGTVDIRIGQRVGSNAFQFFGSMYDLRLYNRGLSNEEIYSLYDPKSRWELYKPKVPLFQNAFVPVVAPGGNARRYSLPLMGVG